ncbi:MAG: hypothetical protein ACHRXM_06760 [Isosphaerales bacterium]
MDEACPGLRWQSGRSIVTLLSLHGVAQAGRFESGAFSGATLLGFERHRAGVQATFAPAGWGGLVVRAGWSPDALREAVDLEIQVSATSVGELSALEVAVVSRLGEIGGNEPTVFAGRVEPRDGRSAALSYDGRESALALRALTTLPLPESPRLDLRPLVVAPPGAEAGVFYVEMAHPNDVARRISGEHVRHGSTTAIAQSTRYGLFGHDLEKGVVLRARLRGCWIRSRTPEDDALALYREFLREPLPLGP